MKRGVIALPMIVVSDSLLGQNIRQEITAMNLW